MNVGQKLKLKVFNPEDYIHTPWPKDQQESLQTRTWIFHSERETASTTNDPFQNGYKILRLVDADEFSMQTVWPADEVEIIEE